MSRGESNQQVKDERSSTKMGFAFDTKHTILCLVIEAKMLSPREELKAVNKLMMGQSLKTAEWLSAQTVNGMNKGFGFLK